VPYGLLVKQDGVEKEIIHDDFGCHWL